MCFGRSARVAAVFAVLVGVVGAVTPGTAAAARASLPVLVVSASTNLVDAQHITVTDPGGPIGDYYNLCATVTPLDREVSCGYIPVVSYTKTTTTLEISPLFFTNDPLARHDCRTMACQIVDFPSGPATAAVPVTFNAAAPMRPSPTLTVTPSAGLSDGQIVSMDQNPPFPGSAGFSECAAPTSDIFVPHEPCEPIGFPIGVGPHTGPVTAFAETSNGPVDCRAPGATCVVEGMDAIFRPVDTAVSFIADGALVPRAARRPTLVITSGLYPTNTVDAMGFTPGDTLTVRWCSPVSGACGDSAIAMMTADSAGLGAADIGAHPASSATDEAICKTGCLIAVIGTDGKRATLDDYSWTLGSFPTIPVGGSLGGPGTTTTTTVATVASESQPAAAVTAQPTFTG
jgi:hypothetical protein